MLFEWTGAKDRANRKKHGIAFADIVTVFDDPRIISKPDERHSENEERWLSLGRTSLGFVCVVIHTVRFREGEEWFRIISARSATEREEMQYYSA